MCAYLNILSQRLIVVTLVISLSTESAEDVGAGTSAKRALVLGGTQFMGRWMVERLLSEGFRVTVFNRGETPYPWPESLVGRLKADRMKDRTTFRTLLKESGDWDVIVDFTGFHVAYMHDTVESLRRAQGGFSVRHYIYISSDSVYWDLKLPDDDSRLNESSPEPFSAEEKRQHQQYSKQTSTGEYQIGYGGYKLTCDMYLQKAFAEDGFPFTSLRLPDVYGPYDNMGGFWMVADAVRKSDRLGAMLPLGRIRPRGSRKALDDHSKHQVTWVFVADVVDAIMAVISVGRHFFGGAPGSPFGEIFHIAHEEAVSLEELASLISDVARASSKLRRLFTSQGAMLDYAKEAELPTTDFGALDISKAKKFLKWRPRPMKEAVQVSLEWYFGDRKGYPADIKGKKGKGKISQEL